MWNLKLFTLGLDVSLVPRYSKTRGRHTDRSGTGLDWQLDGYADYNAAVSPSQQRARERRAISGEPRRIAPNAAVKA